MYTLLEVIWAAAAFIGLTFLVFSLGPYLLWHYSLSLACKSQDLRQRYHASWAIVTGASSGIGKALVHKCAQQGLHVLMVARPDDLLEAAYIELCQQYPEQTFRKVAVDLGQKGYIDAVTQALDGILVQVCFLNAGYVQTGFFHQTALEKHYANLECNVGHVVGLSHLLLNRMMEANASGCVVLTSSAAAVMPGPFVSLYNSTKAFLSAFGSSLAAEVRPQGIDITVFHPSPVASRFASSADHQIDLLDFFNAFAVPPEALPDAMFGAVGRCVWRDFGAVAVCFRVISKLVDFNLLAWTTALSAPLMPDYKRHWASTSRQKDQ